MNRTLVPRSLSRNYQRGILQLFVLRRHPHLSTAEQGSAPAFALALALALALAVAVAVAVAVALAVAVVVALAVAVAVAVAVACFLPPSPKLSS